MIVSGSVCVAFFSSLFLQELPCVKQLLMLVDTFFHYYSSRTIVSVDFKTDCHNSGASGHHQQQQKRINK